MKSTIVKCPSELDIAHAVEFRNELLKVGVDKSVKLDPSGITRVDGTGVQLLLAFTRHLDSKGCAWSWSDESPGLRRAAQDLGLADQLRLAPVEE